MKNNANHPSFVKKLDLNNYKGWDLCRGKSQEIVYEILNITKSENGNPCP